MRAENVVFDGDSLSLGSGKYVMMSVRAHGCGIAAEVLPCIFSPYFTTKQGGTGLGLATAHAIIAKHEGYITVQSSPGVETTFSIYTPACETAQPEESTVGQQLQTSSAEFWLWTICVRACSEQGEELLFLLFWQRIRYGCPLARPRTLAAIRLSHRARLATKSLEHAVSRESLLSYLLNLRIVPFRGAYDCFNHRVLVILFDDALNLMKRCDGERVSN